MEQGTDEWLAWRNKGIGASDVPIILGVSPYQTPYQLYQYKKGLRKPPDTNFIMQRGHDMEPRARAAYELCQFDDVPDFPPKCVEHPHFEYMRASLDGYNYDLKKILEIKYPGVKEHEACLSGEIPEKYYPQVQYQLFCTSFEIADFISYRQDHAKPLAIIEVHRNNAYIDQVMIPRVRVFWKNIELGIPPPLMEPDTLDVECLLFKEWQDIKNKKTNGDLLKARQAIIDNFKRYGHNRVRSYGLSVSKNKKDQFRFTTAKRLDL